MQLKYFKVTKCRNVWDSGWIDINKITAFVGQNEAGKSNLFEALYRINPFVPNEANGYYNGIRLLGSVHRRLRLLVFPTRTDGHPPRRRTLLYLGGQQSAVPPAAGPLALRGRYRRRDPCCRRCSRLGCEADTLTAGSRLVGSASKEARAEIRAAVDAGSHLYTDALKSYLGLDGKRPKKQN
jgi:hypothetical protein